MGSLGIYECKMQHLVFGYQSQFVSFCTLLISPLFIPSFISTFLSKYQQSLYDVIWQLDFICLFSAFSGSQLKCRLTIIQITLIIPFQLIQVKSSCLPQRTLQIRVVLAFHICLSSFQINLNCYYYYVVSQRLVIFEASYESLNEWFERQPLVAMGFSNYWSR